MNTTKIIQKYNYSILHLGKCVFKLKQFTSDLEIIC